MKKKIFPEVIACLLAALYAYTAYIKLTDHFTFKIELALSPVMHPIANFAAWAIPLTEAAVVILLIGKNSRLWGLYASAAMLTIFTLYLLGIVLFSADLPCSCGGFISNLSFGEHIVFNLFFLALSVTGIVLIKRKANNIQQNSDYIYQQLS